MIAFDYVTANWDRWSGANVAQDGATGMVLFVDNDGAFYEAPPPDALARQLALLRRVVRFSRRFVTAVRALDSPKLADVFGDESPGQPLLTERAVQQARTRYETARDIIAGRVTDTGEDTTLALP
jgi:hypothetical protein